VLECVAVNEFHMSPAVEPVEAPAANPAETHWTRLTKLARRDDYRRAKTSHSPN